MVKDPMDGYWQERNDSALRAHLIRSAEIVAAWPAWKRSACIPQPPATDSMIKQLEAT